jgi:hypothetical protein
MQFIQDEMLGDNADGYLTTPISQSAGAALISNLPSIPALKDRMSPNEVLGLLDTLAIHVDNYGENLMNLPNWKNLVHLKYKEFLDLLTSAQSMALSLDNHSLIKRCTDLMSKLEEFKMKLSLQSAGESSLASFHGFPSLVQNVSRDAPRIPDNSDYSARLSALEQSAAQANVSRNTPRIPDNSDYLARLSALEQSAAQVNRLVTNFPQLAKRVASLEFADSQAFPPIVEELERVSTKLNEGVLHSQDFEARMRSLENTQQQALQKCDGIRSSALKYQDSIKSLTRALTVLQTSVSSDMEIMRRNFNELAGQFRAANQHTVVVSQANVPATNAHTMSNPLPLPVSRNVPTAESAANNQQVSSFEPQVFRPPITNIHRSNVASHVPIYTTAPMTNNSDLLVTNWLDTNNFSSIPHNFPHTGPINHNYQGQTHSPNVEMPRHANKATPRVWQPAFQPPHTQPQGPHTRQSPQPGHHHQQQAHGEENYSNGSDDESRQSALNIQGKMLRGQMIGLEGLLSPSPNEDLPKSTILDLHKNRVVAVENQTQNLQRSLRDYIRSDGHSSNLCDRASNVIFDSIIWSSKIRQLYQTKGVHKRSQGGKLYDILPKFSPKSEIDVFTFLKRFESSTEDFDYPEEKAELLYNKFLCSSIQEEMVKYKLDYAQMRKMLLHRYADPKIIMTNLLSSVSKESLPTSNSDVFVTLSYYRKLQSALEKMNALLKSQDTQNKDLEVYVTSTDFLHSLLLLVPQDGKGEFFKEMGKCGEDSLHIRGITPFRLLVSAVNEQYEFHDRLSRNSVPPTQKGRRDQERPRPLRSHHTLIQQDSSEPPSLTDSESDTSVESDQGCSVYPSQVNFQKGGKSSRDANIRQNKPIAKFEFPCIMEDHKHSLSDCREFFLKTPKERAELRRSYKYRHCLVCLKSSETCTARRCNNISTIPKVLLCKDCRNDQKANKSIRIYNVLFCFREDHQKPSNPELLSALESYIPGFKSSMLKAPISLISHFQVLNLSKNSKPKSLTSPVDVREPAPIFNTCTGDLEDDQDLDFINEIREDSISVMQTLNIKGRLVLTLFDRGANQHLVDGRLAEDLGFKPVSQNVTAIGVVSGGSIWTDFGTYQTFLGPNPHGKYFEVICQGMSNITSTFPKYDLANVNAEALEFSDIPQDAKLPPYIGGERVGLLIGLKASELEPECILTLPSGVGLYRSQFCDAFGSRYCYGGPNKAFSMVNKRFHGNVGFLKAYFTQAISQYRNSLYPSLLDKYQPEIADTGCNFSHLKDPSLTYSYESYCGQDIMPTPLTANDFEELGQSVNGELESSLLLCPEVHCTCLTSSKVFKAKVPLSKQRSYLDEQDMDDTINYKCSKCSKCKCSSSNREKMLSLNEAIEQKVIEDSVTINLDEEKVEVDLPFITDPDKFLSERHGGMDNYNQAYKVYKSQCRLPDSTKEGIKASIEDLQGKGFLKKLSDLPLEHQALIGNGRFKHFMPWRVVSKKESTSTPHRPVVDPSMSGLNLCLAKGTNRMRKINDILIRARCRKYLWSSDISKLYNRLHLKPSSYTYQLFLYNTSMNPDIPPEVFVMVVCWYGVTSSANQSCYALEELARLFKDQYPLAYHVITRDTYVDDMLSGSNSEKEREDQISQVSAVLKAGGFQTKFIVQSGQSSEDEFLRILGYRWSVTQDFLSPGFTEINFSKKRRGLKDPVPFTVEKPSDVAKLLESLDITRRIVISKIAELFDPVGLWEAYKFQLKLASNVLSGVDWDLALPKESQGFWLEKFHELLLVPIMKLDRYVFPSWAPVDKIRLICVSDAAANAGGGIVYAGIKLPNGSFSCKLLSSRSKLMKESVPRNELEAIRVTAGLAFDVKNSLGDMVSDVIYLTDSVIALSWCHNLDKRLRLFCFNRVTEIRRLIQAATNTETLPLYHIDGKLNPADLITKPSNISPSDLTEDSIWVNGYDWMKLPLIEMPLTSYSDICISAQQKSTIGSECFPEAILPSQRPLCSHIKPVILIHCTGCADTYDQLCSYGCDGISFENPHCLHCKCNTSFFSLSAKAGKGDEPIVDVLKLGYPKALRILSKVIDFGWTLGHKAHSSKGVDYSQGCKKCVAISESNGIPIEFEKHLLRESKNYLFRKESSRLLGSLPKEKLKRFQIKDGILYNQSRLPQDAKVVSQDLDFDVFFDAQEIKSVLPVVSTDSQLFYSILMYVHHFVRAHSGNEATLREISKLISPLGNAKRVISKVRKSCPRCRIILLKTFEVEIGNHPQSRFQLVPAFYHSMADIVYGFAGKPHNNSRTTLKLYGLVIVCLLTSATSILALEGISTQDIVMALERHSARHGVPAAFYVDQGTQLTNLDKLEGTLRDANLQIRNSLGLKILPSLPKNHMQRGRVERKIRTLRDMLKKVAINTNVRMTPLEWETVFLKMASQIDDVPMARADRLPNSDLGWELLTPNRFKLGRNNNRAIEGTLTITDNTTPTQLLKRVQDIQRYWYELLLDRLHHLIPKPDNVSQSVKIKLEDIVCFRFIDNVNNKLEIWKLGKVVEIVKGGQGVMISYVTFTPKGKVRMSCVTRSPRDVVIVTSMDELCLNSSEFFQKITRISE